MAVDTSAARQPAATGLLTAALCFLVANFEGVDIQAAGLVAPKVAPLYHLSPAQLGWFFSASTIGLIVGALVGGRMADRFGRKGVLLISMAAFGLFSMLTPFSWSFETLVLARFLTGVGLGGALPNLVALAAENAPDGRRNFAVSLVYSGMPFGGGLASLLLGVVTGDWRVIFYVGGLAPLLAVPVVWFWLPESLSFAQRQPAEGRGDPIQALFGGGRALKTLGLWVGFFCALVVLFLLLNWLPSMMVARGLSRSQAALVQAAFNLIGAGGALVTGWAMDGRARSWVIALMFIALAVVLAVFGAAPATFTISLVLGSLVGAATLGSQTAFYSLAPSVYPTAVRGTGVGAGVAAGRLGSVAGPLLAGALLGQGKSVAEILIALLPLVAVGGVIAFVLSLARPTED